MRGNGFGLFLFPLPVSVGGSLFVGFCAGHAAVSSVREDTEKDSDS